MSVGMATTLPALKSSGSQQSEVRQPSGRGQGSGPARLGLYRRCEIPPELSRTWHLDSG